MANSPQQKQLNPITDFSYSSFQTLDLCPRKAELEKNVPQEEKTYHTADYDDVDLLFGTVVHKGCQCLFNGQSVQEAIWQCFLAWKAPLSLKKKSKTFWTALDAVHKIQPVIKNLLDEGWEIAELETDIALKYGEPGKIIKKGVEISFRIFFNNDIFGNQYKLRGHIDIILRHKVTGEYKVIELKSTSFSNVDESSFGNSEQGLSYSVVLDKIAPDQASYEVLYLVWKESQACREWEIMPFMKSKTNKAEWLRDTIDRFELIDLFKKKGYFPKRGQNCFNFFRRCQYYGVCNLPIRALVPQQINEVDNQKRRDPPVYDFEFTLMDIIEQQITLADF